MSQKSVEQIMGKMLLDIEFRRLMVSDRKKALADFDLTADEREGFNQVDFDEFDQELSVLDERVSKYWGGYLIWTGGW